MVNVPVLKLSSNPRSLPTVLGVAAAWFKKCRFRVTLACQSLPQKFGIFHANGKMTEACVAPAGSALQRLQIPEPKQREPVRMPLSRHQLLGTFALPLSDSAA